MSCYSEWSNPTSKGGSCSYNTLCSYNSNSMGFKHKPTKGVYVVPNYTAPGYDTLVGKPGSCGCYGNISNAYGSHGGRCNQAYTTSLCGGNCGGNKPHPHPYGPQ